MSIKSEFDRLAMPLPLWSILITIPVGLVALHYAYWFLAQHQPGVALGAAVVAILMAVLTLGAIFFWLAWWHYKLVNPPKN